MRKLSELFEEIEEIGVGTFGSVYRAINKSTAEIVALKVFKLFSDNHKCVLPPIFKNEVNLMKKLRGSRNIVALKQSYDDLCWEYPCEDVPCLVIEMEYCEGGDMFTKLSSTGEFN